MATQRTQTFGRYPDYTRGRLKKAFDLVQGLVHRDRTPPGELLVAGPTDRISTDEASRLAYQPARLGMTLGPMWATFWFRLRFDIPHAWRTRPVELLWDSYSEALIWERRNGSLVPAQGLNFDRQDFRVVDRAAGGEHVDLLIEAACNYRLGWDDVPGFERAGVRHRPGPAWLEQAEFAWLDAEAQSIAHALRVLTELEADRTPPQTVWAHGGGNNRPLIRPALDSAWWGHLLHELNRFCNVFDAQHRGTWPEAAAILNALLACRNGSIAHDATVLGHAHIDTAWLWPIDETRRKCMRTFATQCRYMDRWPWYKFVCSQAYQYEVIEQRSPDLFARIRERVERGQWLPVGGSWVEPDCNVPSGESLCRQFLYGQRYFESRFGRRCREFWNPDVFGYNGQLPQIMRHAGIDRFLTQKLSWNGFTLPPHHTFHWAGIDGSCVLTHFPPADTYNSEATIANLRYHAANYKDHDRGTDAMLLYGWGDGGGGPTPRMIETLARCADLQGVPRCEARSVDDFFDRLATRTREIPTIRGELYLEYHRGTYTSQARTKQLNRQAEVALHEAELFATLAMLDAGREPPRDRLADAWKLVLLNQFHDILPGTSIREVVEQTERELSGAIAAAREVAKEAASAVAARNTSASAAAPPFNCTHAHRAEVITDEHGSLAWADCPPFASGTRSPMPPPAVAPVTLTIDGPRITLANGLVTATLTDAGELVSLRTTRGDELLAGTANRLLLHHDDPMMWTAWDIDPTALESARVAPPAEGYEILTRHPLRAELLFHRRLSAQSTLRQTVRLDAGSPLLEFCNELDWHDRLTLLRAAFPTTVHAMHATFGIQFGAVARPTTTNTPGDAAMFEVPGRWADLGQPGRGLSLLSDCKYGYSARDATLTLSLMRGPTYPDRLADLGRHRFVYALLPHTGDWREHTLAAEARLNHPLRPGPHSPRALIEAAHPAVVIDTIKPAEGSRDIIVRLHEAHGTHTAAKLRARFHLATVLNSNTLEDALEQIAFHPTNDGTSIPLELRPYEIRTLRLTPA